MVLKNTTIFLKIIECVNLIVNFCSSNEKLSTAVFGQEDGYDFPHFRLNYNIPMATEVPFWPPNFYIFNSLTDAEIVFVISSIRTNVWFTPSAKFIFVGSGFTNSILKYLAKENLLRVMFFDTTSRSLYTVNPYRKGSYKAIDTTLDSIGVCGTDKININESSLFQPTIPTNWKGSKLRVLHQQTMVFSDCFICESKFKGIESEIFYTIIEYLGIRPSPNTYDNYNSFIMEHPKYRVGVIFGALAMELGLNSFDTTIPYLEEYIAFFVPPQRFMARWKYILTVFSIEIWLAWLISVTIISMAWSLSHYKSTRIWISGRCFNMFVAAYKLFLTQSYSFPTLHISHGTISLCIVILSTMMNFFFGTRLTYILNGVNYESNINSFKELENSQLFIGIPTSFFRKLVETEIKDYPENLIKNCYGDQYEICVNRSSGKRDIALVSSVRQLRYEEKVEGKKGNQLLKQLKPPLFSAKFLAFFRKGNPVFPLINRMLGYLVESGIVNKITEKYDRLMTDEESPMSVTQRLSMEHIAAPGFILVVGLIISFIVFILESKNFINI
ncbi:hypothetical protein WA026_012137 [Henosepilachna vigintioctopunctata]|uniref:Ionotropic receptor n=1 Tax=Henosepilachna vigintioctopunctata TaxID=420089 RepID=A0AAW1VE48_9CUCU